MNIIRILFIYILYISFIWLHKVQSMWIKWHRHEKLHVHDRYQIISRHLCTPNYILCFQLKYYTEVYNKYFSNMTISINIFWINIFNICIMWLNMMYILSNFIAPHCNATVPLLQHCIIKNSPLYGIFLSVCRMIIEHDFISDLVVVVDYFIIFKDIVFINSHLILLTY